jgi:imidazole glycerol-phosphate synthase subunit HisH
VTARLAVLDYGIGNLRSAQKTLERVGATARLTADPVEVASADGVVLPGVGHFGACARALRDTGLDEVARAAVAAGQPFLGICIGAQLMFDRSDEAPNEAGLGFLPGRVVSLPDGVRRPQMQWNRLCVRTPAGPLFDGLGEDAWMYFVHSFAPQPSHGTDILATCDYGGPVVAAAGRDGLWAVQFHPEKSGQDGRRLLANFVAAVA